MAGWLNIGTNPDVSPSAISPEPLLDLNLGADFLEFLLDGLGLVLGHAFFHRLGRALDQILGFLEAERRDLADDLDDVDLVGADLAQHDVEFGLLFHRSGGAAARAGHRHRHRHGGRRGHAEFRFERLHELRELEHADALDVIDDLLLRHFGHRYLLVPNPYRIPNPDP